MLYQIPLSALFALLPVLVSSSPTPTLVSEAMDLATRGDIAKRTYPETCNRCSLQDRRAEFGITPNLDCECGNGSGGTVRTWIDLSGCFANADGWLQWRRDGRAFSSCHSWSLVEGRQLVAYCTTVDQKYRQNKVWLNERIHNRNGYLSCDV